MITLIYKLKEKKDQIYICWLTDKINKKYKKFFYSATPLYLSGAKSLAIYRNEMDTKLFLQCSFLPNELKLTSIVILHSVFTTY